MGGPKRKGRRRIAPVKVSTAEPLFLSRMPPSLLRPLLPALALSLAPVAFDIGAGAATATAADAGSAACGIWLGPSPIKEAEDHGWGHSIFTGRFIPEGAVVFAGGVLDEASQLPAADGTPRKSFGDLFVPVYDWEEMDVGAYASAGMDDDDDDGNGEGEGGGIDKAPGAHSMLFQETWNGDDFPGIVLESLENMRVYMPGLANICPCTSDGYNLEQIKKVNYRDWRPAPRRGDGKSRNESDNKPPSPQAGGFSYLSNAMFVATRDIPPGEELVVECEGNTDMFDPGDYPPVHFVPEDAGGYSVCLDDRVEERLADHTPNVASAGAGGDGYGGGQRGLFARRKLKRGESLTSTPMIPVHKNETNMDGGRQQLLLNYMFGHPESSLLWLPQAPLILAANHYASYGSSGDEKVQRKQPNAKVQWHSDEYTKAQAAGKPLSRRQQFHHAELLKMESVEVVQKHGMGLMIDLVATQTIDEGEEVLVDYGEAWDEAMKAHILGWDEAIAEAKNDHEMHKLVYKKRRKLEHKQHELAGEGGGLTDSQLHHHRQRDSENALSAVPFSSYVTASDYNELHANDDIRTISEQHRNPYPSNIETACHFEYDWLDDEINDDPDADRVTFESWYNQNDHFDSTCLLPCIVTERREYVPGEEKEARTSSYYDDYDDDGYDESQRELDDDRLTNTEFGGSFSPKRYTAKLVDAHELNTSINFQCHIYKRFEYIYIDIPREGIVFIDKPHSSDQWIEHAFRQPIGLPDEMVPQNWRDLATQKKGMRGGRTESKPTILSTTAKNAPMTKEEKEYQLSVKRWNMVETRRERLDETADKRQLDFSAREDL